MKKQEVSKNYTKYVQLYEQYWEEYDILFPPQNSKSDWFSNRDLERDSYIKGKIPEQVVKDCKAWRSYNNQIKNINYQIKDMSVWAKEEAVKILRAEAYSTRKIVSYIWISLIIAMLLRVGVSSFSNHKTKSGN